MALKQILTRDLTQPDPIPEEGIARAIELMRSGRLFRYGEMGADQLDASALEQEFAAFVGRRFAIGLNSGGSAIFMALKVAGVAPGDSVLVNGFTLAPVPGAIVHAGAKPVIVGITPDLVIDLDDLAIKARESGAKVLLLSHMRGHIPDMGAVLALVAKLGLKLIEDCAHALCASWNGQAIGTFGLAAAFSAQTYKHLNSGEGGFLVLDDPECAAKAILHSGSYMLHAQHLSRPESAAFEQQVREVPNFSMRITALAAAMLRPQLKALQARADRWRALYARIAKGLEGLPMVRMPVIAKGANPSPTSIQFLLPGASGDEMRAVLDAASARKLPIKWFGAREQIGFTSAPRHWNYAGLQHGLEHTHDILSTLCDIRLPLSLENSEADLIVEIVSDSLDHVFGAQARPFAPSITALPERHYLEEHGDIPSLRKTKGRHA